MCFTPPVSQWINNASINILNMHEVVACVGEREFDNFQSRFANNFVTTESEQRYDKGERNNEFSLAP